MNDYPQQTGPSTPGSEAPQALGDNLQRMALKSKISTAAGWFYWIAGLTVVNAVIHQFGGSWRFVLGTGTTDVIDAVLLQTGTGHAVAGSIRLIALGLDLLIAAIIAFWGFICGKGLRWAFVVGMVLYLLDGVLEGFLQEWLSAAFHVYAIYCIFQGLSAANALAKLNKYTGPNFRQEAHATYGTSPDAWPPPANPEVGYQPQAEFEPPAASPPE